MGTSEDTSYELPVAKDYTGWIAKNRPYVSAASQRKA
jgi:hypothetical protein